MERNVGKVDRLIRLIVGLALMGAAANGYLGTWAWIGVVLVLTAAISFCPIYMLLHMGKFPRD